MYLFHVLSVILVFVIEIRRLLMLAESDISSGSKVKEFDRLREGSSCIPSSSYSQRIIDPQVGSFLRTNWQIQGNLLDQADAIERYFFFLGFLIRI